MKKVVNEEMKWVELWVTNAEQQSEGFEDEIKRLCSLNKAAGYKTIVFRSGKRNLYDCTEGLILNNLRS